MMIIQHNCSTIKMIIEKKSNVHVKFIEDYTIIRHVFIQITPSMKLLFSLDFAIFLFKTKCSVNSCDGVTVWKQECFIL